jgi:hypothetical protein
MSDPEETDLTTVRLALRASALPATEQEIRMLATGYPHQRAAVDALYDAPGVRYVDPALRFRAQARITDWAD